MYAQFSQGIPGLVIDTEKKTIHVDTSNIAEGIESVYKKYLDGDLDYFAVTEDHARGFYEFLKRLKDGPKDMQFVKGQITGPVSYALFLTDQNKRSLIYDKDMFEVLTKVLVMKARWQIRKLKECFPRVVIFMDEPYLVSIGSSFVNINMEEAAKRIDELAGAIRQEGATVGIHCCGNTDWSLLLKRDIDIINFDAYNFMKEFLLYTEDLKAFIGRGGTVAWGVVPSSESVAAESVKTLVERLKAGFDLMAAKGLRQDEVSSIITSSCGLGTLDKDKATRILELAARLSDKLQK